VTHVSDETSVNSAPHNAVELRLTAELEALKHQRDKLELEVLSARDHVAVQVGMLRSQLETSRTDDLNHRQHIERLEAALAEAADSRRELLVTLGEVRRQLESVRGELADMKSSATWKTGWVIMTPVRLAKRVMRRG
jgi:chromosome segregation ATPase